MTKRLIAIACVFASANLAMRPASAGMIDRLNAMNLRTEQGRAVRFENQFFEGRHFVAGDPAAQLLKYAFPTVVARADETAFVGRARYAVAARSTLLSRAFFNDLRALSYLLGPSNRLQLLSANPFRLACSKSVGFGVTVHSQQTIRVIEASELRADPPLRALVARLASNGATPERVVLQSFSSFSDYFDVGAMLTMIYGDGPKKTYVDLVSVSLIHTLPPLIGRGFISDAAAEDLKYYVDHLAYLERQ